MYKPIDSPADENDECEEDEYWRNDFAERGLVWRLVARSFVKNTIDELVPKSKSRAPAGEFSFVWDSLRRYDHYDA
ncbi:uncharacterized protein PG998_014023 [Apiospora kogelbergensis]|uniref:Uncharacterized protein n=1 Tax=Apiospora kogelbergensis TaxID=1337665 RepID=A0AAW0QYU9_9PEZI